MVGCMAVERNPSKSKPEMPPMSNPASPTSKQFGDACEMLVAGYMTLAGIPTTVMPDSWPDYDLIAQHSGNQTPLRISVKARGQSRRGGGEACVSLSS